MRKLFSLFLALVATTSLWASDFSVDGIYYNYLDGNNVEVTYRGNYPNNYGDEYAGEVVIPSTVRYNGITYSVTSIGDYAFCDCSSLTSVTIGNSVTSIGDKAFFECSSLTSVTIGNSVTSIGDYAFYGCSKLTSVTINSDAIVSKAYSYDSNISHIFGSQVTEYIIGESVTGIGNHAFDACYKLTAITIPNSVTSIGEWAFSSCSSLTSITIPNTVTCIGRYTFDHCSSLTSVTIGESVTGIGNHAFDACYKLTAITIPNSVTSIGEWAFSSCSSLTSITIPNSVTSIADYAFYGCSSLAAVTLTANSVEEFCQGRGNGLLYNAGVYSERYIQIDGKDVVEITIPNSITSIEDFAFYECSALTSVTIHNSITSIEFAAFAGCSSLTSVTIPNSVTSIGSYAFNYCSSLTSVTIGNSVTSIGNFAFYGCTALESVVWNAKNCANPSNKEAAPFYYICSQIKSFTFGENVEHIPAYLCYGMDKLTSVTSPNSLKTIGTSAFEGCARLGKINLGTSLEDIAANAFAGCTRLYDIYVYATYPPFAEESSFANYNVYVYIPCEYQRDYILDVVWGKFKFIECIESEETTTDGNVTVVPGTNDVTITWPTEDNADTYTIVIKKDGEVFCTLTFNAEGQLLNIAFAPGRDGNHPAQYAEQAVNGYRFTVTSLESGTKYGYNIDVKDASNKTIKSHSGEFTTQSTTAVDNITTNNANIQKIIRYGQFIIVRDGVEYNAIGQELGN